MYLNVYSYSYVGVKQLINGVYVNKSMLLPKYKSLERVWINVDKKIMKFMPTSYPVVIE